MFPWPLAVVLVAGIGGIVYWRKMQAAQTSGAVPAAAAAPPAAGPPLPNLPGLPQVSPVAPAAPPPPPAAVTKVVTTNDAAGVGSAYGPGDLIIRSSPDNNAPQIGGADKGGTVTILNADAGNGYSQISWGGGRLPAVPNGYAHSAYLK